MGRIRYGVTRQRSRAHGTCCSISARNLFVADIRKRGLEGPITLYEGKILDGRNRYRACREAGIEPRFVKYADDDPAGFVVSKNVFCRHLTTVQKRDLIAKPLTADPGRSDRATAALIGVDHKTVGAVPARGS